jgi:hypothetical protein
MSEQVASENWQHYSSTLPKRKRADLVCVSCHAKKIKCDLQQQRNNGKNSCKSCSAAGRQCQVRPSKREKRRKGCQAGPAAPLQQLDEGASKGVNALLAADATFQTFTEHSTTHMPIVDVSPNQFSPRSFRGIPTTDLQSHTSPRSIFQHSSNRVESPADQRHQMNASLAETTPTQNGDVDTGFLQVYAEENQFDANTQALVAQLEHRYSSDLRPDLEQIFTDTYFTYCYPWCPVLDRSTLSADVARSPLLANALALASSHIQPPLLPHDGSEAYYKRARTIFYDDEESDETMALKALCLFYWWAPQSPSRVHRHSSWWWTSVIIRHAQQMNIHREPAISDPQRNRIDLGLRRRIWWTAFVSSCLIGVLSLCP